MSAPTAPDPWLAIIIALTSAGGLKYAYDVFIAVRSRPEPSLRRQGVVDASIASVALARDELAEDNVRLRQMLAEERKQRQEERIRYLEDISRLEERIRLERTEATQRYDALLSQVQHLRAGHRSTDPREP